MAEFDSKAWFAKLLAANDWARDFKPPTQEDWDAEHGHAVEEGFRAARKAACWERYQAGTEAWNEWTDAMLALKAELEAAGLWRVKTQSRLSGDRYIYLLKGETAESAAFAALCRADFAGAEFAETTGLGQWRFPGVADFQGATFTQRADFRGATFTQTADFQGATFTEWAVFRGATFTEGAVFQGATFTQRADFRGATFTQTADFQGATFTEWAVFQGATFTEGAVFEGATFTERADFEGATFTQTADFAQAEFNGYTTFEKAEFHGFANFSAAQGKEGSAFTLESASFENVPDFIQADFRKAPRLDNIKVRSAERGAEISARWRALKGLAIDGHDHERERDFFAHEILSLRWRVDSPIWSNADRFWFGVFYQLVSNFGRSVLRPVLCWLATIGLFFLFYLHMHLVEAGRKPVWDWAQAAYAGAAEPLACRAGAEEPALEALQLSFSKAFVIGNLIDANRAYRTQACLFGIDRVRQQGESDLRSFPLPKTPFWVSIVSAFQVLMSATLIFLFLMAVRNQFRIQ